MNNILTDAYGRTITNVRMALTNACNLRCIYCHHEGEEINGCTVGESSHPETKDEITELIGVFADLGVTTIKLTGGEPTLRPPRSSGHHPIHSSAHRMLDDHQQNPSWKNGS